MQNKYALIRVSTKKQKEYRQIIRIEKLGIPKENIIIEKESGRSKARPKFEKLIKQLKAGDIFYIENIDRLSRDYDGIIKTWKYLEDEKQVFIKVLDTPMLDSDQITDDLVSRFMRDILLHTSAFQAALEWEKIKSRQADGIAIAKDRGETCGRPKAVRTERELNIVRQYLDREIDLNTALAKIKRKKTSFYDLCQLVLAMQE